MHFSFHTFSIQVASPFAGAIDFIPRFCHGLLSLAFTTSLGANKACKRHHDLDPGFGRHGHGAGGHYHMPPLWRIWRNGHSRDHQHFMEADTYACYETSVTDQFLSGVGRSPTGKWWNPDIKLHFSREDHTETIQYTALKKKMICKGE